MTDAPKPREEMPSPRLARGEFERRFLRQFSDPAFATLKDELDRIAATAWDAYADSRKSPLTRKAGPSHADPDYDLSVDWIDARAAIREAEARRAAPGRPSRVLLINASPRPEHTCPGETSKSWRLAEIARGVVEAHGADVEVLDLSRLSSEYGRQIHPCKACFSTAAALCHWPCSCYPNHSLGQSQDWMNEIYPMWVAADGVVMIVTPVHWYQVSSPLKLMIDRLVCADGGNADPTLTHGKDAAKAKALELEGWSYKQHLEGRFYAVVVHGDVEGAGAVRPALTDWLKYTGLRPAGTMAKLDRYIGYQEPYATSHEAMDADADVQEEVRNAARTLVAAIAAAREGRLVAADEGLTEPRPK